VAQDVILAFFHGHRSIRDPSKIRAWLAGVTWRTIRAHQRRRFLRVFLPSPSPSPDAGLHRTEAEARVRQVLDGLSPRDRHLLLLRYVDDLDRAEMARVLDIPEGTLGRWLTAARARFEVRARRLGLDAEAFDEPVFSAADPRRCP